MQNGEYWIDESGQTEYADGDVGDTNHEMIAFKAALGLDEDEYESREWLIPGVKFTLAQQKELLKLGVSKKVVDYFKKGADARDYALEHMGWVRVRMRDFQVWTLDDARLKLIQGADFWDEGDEDESEDTINLEEMSSRGWWNCSFKVILGAQSSEGLKAYLNRAAAGRRLGGLSRPAPRWMRVPGGR